jgi:hypothetical protein
MSTLFDTLTSTTEDYTTMPAIPAVKPIRLSPRDMQIMIALGQYKYLTTDQIRRLFCTTDHKTTVHNRMVQLKRAGFLTVRRIYTTEDSAERGAKSCVYFLRPENIRAIITHLVERGKPELLGTLRDLPTIDKHDNLFAHAPLVHETGLSETLLLFNLSASLRGDRIPFFEQTSRAKYIEEQYDDTEITAENKTRKKRVTFSPDGVFCYFDHHTRSAIFPTIEFDNDTETLDTWRAKVTAYLRFLASGKFPAFITYYSNKYNLGFSDRICEAFDLLVLTVTPTPYRRNQLLRETSRLPQAELRRHFFFAALPDLTADTITGTSWLNADDYRPIFDREKQLPCEMRKSVRLGWIEDEISKLRRISLLDIPAFA